MGHLKSNRSVQEYILKIWVGEFSSLGNIFVALDNYCLWFSIWKGDDSNRGFPIYATIISGLFCGHDGERFISTGSSLLLVFQSGPGGPSWDYSGFELNVADRWRGEYIRTRGVLPGTTAALSSTLQTAGEVSTACTARVPIRTRVSRLGLQRLRATRCRPLESWVLHVKL